VNITMRREVERLRRSAARTPPKVEMAPGFQLTPRWYPLRPHAVQRAYWLSPHRFNTAPCGRRSGKTEIFKRRLVKRAILGTMFPEPRFFAGAPTRDQAKRIFWDDLKALVPEWARSGNPSESELTIPLWHGGEIVVVGMDKPERIEGSPWDGGGLDEYANMKAKAWPEHVRPALSDRGGWCDFTGVPEGRNHYYDTDRHAKAEMLENGPESDWGSFHWRSEDILPDEEIAAAKRELDELTYEQEYGGSFVTFQGRIYYVFEEAIHCRRLFDRYNPDTPLIFAFDFNVAPGVAAVGQEMEFPNGHAGTGWIGEVWIPQGSNTPRVARKLLEDWKDHRGPIVCYGDATGGASGTAKVDGSDWDLLKAILRSGDAEKEIAGFGDRVRFRVPASNPPERSRVNAVNSRLKSVDGTVRMMVDPSRAPHVQKDFEGVKVLDGTTGEIDKKSDPQLTHITDALGYYVAHEFPVKSRKASTSRFKVY
jgi:hypothetical protein